VKSTTAPNLMSIEEVRSDSSHKARDTELSMARISWAQNISALSSDGEVKGTWVQRARTREVGVTSSHLSQYQQADSVEKVKSPQCRTENGLDELTMYSSRRTDDAEHVEQVTAAIQSQCKKQDTAYMRRMNFLRYWECKRTDHNCSGN
jgi:hypothetical protein